MVWCLCICVSVYHCICNLCYSYVCSFDMCFIMREYDQYCVFEVCGVCAILVCMFICVCVISIHHLNHFPINPRVRLMVVWLAGWMVCSSFCLSQFASKASKLHFHSPIGALLSFSLPLIEST